MAAIQIFQARPSRGFEPIIRLIRERTEQKLYSLLLVPDHFTFSAEMLLMDRLNTSGFFLVDIMSPSHLCEQVLETTGREDNMPLTSVGQHIAVSQAAEQLDDLRFFGKSVRNRGFIDKACALIADMRRGNLSAEALSAYSESLPDGLTKAKLCDISAIYREYEAITSDRFSDGMDILDYTTLHLQRSDFLKDKHIFVYGYDKLSQQLMRFLSAAAGMADGVTVSLICDSESAPDGSLYLPIRQSIGRFRDIAEAQERSVREEAVLRDPLSNPVSDYIDRTLFSAKPSPVFSGAEKKVFFRSFSSPYAEASAVGQVIGLLSKDGMDLGKITVFYPDAPDYQFAVSAALHDSGIPFFTDEKMPALSHGLVRYLLASLRAIRSNWHERDMNALLCSGYSSLSFDETCVLQNYLTENGIKREAWAQPFTRGTDSDQVKYCESLRQKVMTPLLKMRAIVSSRKTKAVEGMAAVYQLLLDVHAYDTLEQEEQRLLNEGFYERAGQNSQIWQAVITAFDETVRLAGDKHIPLSCYATRLEAGLASISVASLPPIGGMVHAGVLGHMLAEDAEVVFVLGLSDELLEAKTDSLLDEDERAQLEAGTVNEFGMRTILGFTEKSLRALMKLDIKRALVLPKSRLYLSYCHASTDGTPKRLLPQLTRLFAPEQMGLPEDWPASVLIDTHVLSDAFSESQILNAIGLSVRSAVDGGIPMSEKEKEYLGKALRAGSRQNIAAKFLFSALNDTDTASLDPITARALFHTQALSVSKLENFAGCPFKHFAESGLQPSVLKEWEIHSADTGNFFHEIMDRFAKSAMEEPSFPALPEDKISEIVDEVSLPLKEELLQGPMGDSSRNRARFQAADSAVHRAAITITKQLSEDHFRTVQTEAEFGMGENGLPPIILTLQGGSSVTLRGRIDRIDVYESSNGLFLRTVDYKSSQHKLTFKKVWWGIQLQLLLYLDVCLHAYSEMKPAGAFYFWIDDPLVKCDSDIASAAEEAMAKALQLKGITLSDVIIERSDSVSEEHGSKKQSVRTPSNSLDLRHFTALLLHTRKTAEQLADRLYSGDISISPFDDGNSPVCSYCDYRYVCRFDPNDSNAALRTYPSMDAKKLCELLDAETVQQKSTSFLNPTGLEK